MKKIWDISPAIDAQSAVFPGDTAYSQRLHFALGPSCPVQVNAITSPPTRVPTQMRRCITHQAVKQLGRLNYTLLLVSAA